MKKAQITFVTAKERKEKVSQQRELYEMQTNLEKDRNYAVEMAKQAYKESITDFSKYFHYETAPPRPKETYIAENGTKCESELRMLQINSELREKERIKSSEKKRIQEEEERVAKLKRGEVPELIHGPDLPDFKFLDSDGYMVYTKINPVTGKMYDV